MGDVEKYIAQRKKTDPKFAEGFEDGYQEFEIANMKRRKDLHTKHLKNSTTRTEVDGARAGRFPHGDSLLPTLVVHWAIGSVLLKEGLDHLSLFSHLLMVATSKALKAI